MGRRWGNLYIQTELRVPGSSRKTVVKDISDHVIAWDVIGGADLSPDGWGTTLKSPAGSITLDDRIDLGNRPLRITCYRYRSSDYNPKVRTMWSLQTTPTETPPGFPARPDRVQHLRLTNPADIILQQTVAPSSWPSLTMSPSRFGLKAINDAAESAGLSSFYLLGEPTILPHAFVTPAGGDGVWVRPSMAPGPLGKVITAIHRFTGCIGFIDLLGILRAVNFPAASAPSSIRSGLRPTRGTLEPINAVQVRPPARWGVRVSEIDSRSGIHLTNVHPIDQSQPPDLRITAAGPSATFGLPRRIGGLPVTSIAARQAGATSNLTSLLDRDPVSGHLRATVKGLSSTTTATIHVWLAGSDGNRTQNRFLIPEGAVIPPTTAPQTTAILDIPWPVAVSFTDGRTTHPRSLPTLTKMCDSASRIRILADLVFPGDSIWAQQTNSVITQFTLPWPSSVTNRGGAYQGAVPYRWHHTGTEGRSRATISVIAVPNLPLPTAETVPVPPWF